MAKALAAMSDGKTCGKNSIKVSIDWSSFKDTYVHCAPDCASSGKREIGPKDVADAPVEVLTAIGLGCGEDPAGFKPALLTQVKTVVFTYDKSATPKTQDKGVDGGPNWGPRFQLKKGTLSVGFNWNSTNVSSETKFWLKKHL